MEDEPQIPKYYAGRKILVTGGTGYMGKMLIWKLLKSCPSLDTIYMLVRAKRGKTPTSRRNEIFSNMMFDEFKKNSPEVLKKVVIIAGDVGEEEIGLSQKDRELLIDQVSLIFHGAALLKMDADLKSTINVNTEGTLRMLKLAENMKKLEAFVYFSTAYCCCEKETVEEKIYPSKHAVYDVINLVRWMDPNLLNFLSPRLIDPLPNTYTYSKRLTESLFLDFTSKVPIIIARPTIVIPSFEEPVPGWVDNTNGPIGLSVAVGKGVLRAVMAKTVGKPNFVVVDVAVNAIITLPWANRKEALLNEISVYNIGETEHDSMSWEDMSQYGVHSVNEYPFEKTLWYPSTNFLESNVLIYKFKALLFHWLPAYVIDFVMVLVGQKPFLVYVHSKIQNGVKVMAYFIEREWSFANDKLLRIKNTMNVADKAIFPVTMKALVDDQLYMNKSVFFARKYLFKEDPKTIESCKRKMKLMYLLDKFILVLRYVLLMKILTLIYHAFLRVIEVEQYPIKA